MLIPVNGCSKINRAGIKGLPIDAMHGSTSPHNSKKKKKIHMVLYKNDIELQQTVIQQGTRV